MHFEEYNFDVQEHYQSINRIALFTKCVKQGFFAYICHYKNL